MFFADEYVSDTEKIDRIYTMLRAERRRRTVWLFIKLSLVGLIVYAYYYLSLPIHENLRQDITNVVQTKMTEFIMPMVGNMVQDLTKNMQIPEQTSGSSTTTTNTRKNTRSVAPSSITITPELMKAAQDMLNKK